MARRAKRPVRINLALQGGGAHGAFTWGVLDRLLEDEGIEIAGVSGTSAGALNGAALKAGLARGSRQEARDNLDWLWAEVASISDMRMSGWMAAMGPAPGVFTRVFEHVTPFSAVDAFTRVFSPYDYALLYRNPLEPIAERFHYEDVCCDTGPAFHVSTTNVRTGKIRVFSAADVTPAVILASACLPTLFQAVEIPDPESGEVEAYWDGGFTGNPALFPLFEPHLPDDVVIVNINPLRREDVPKTAQAIQNRINEISFNSSLLRELRAINFVRELIDEGRMPKGAMKNVLVHMIADDVLMTELSANTKMLPSPGLLARLKEAGREAAEAFLEAHRADLNQRGTVDLPEMFG